MIFLGLWELTCNDADVEVLAGARLLKPPHLATHYGEVQRANTFHTGFVEFIW
jgi:hypothetical protein